MCKKVLCTLTFENYLGNFLIALALVTCFHVPRQYVSLAIGIIDTIINTLRGHNIVTFVLQAVTCSLTLVVRTMLNENILLPPLLVVRVECRLDFDPSCL